MFLYKNPKQDNADIEEKNFINNDSTKLITDSYGNLFYFLEKKNFSSSPLSFSGKANYLYFIFMSGDKSGIAEINVNNKKYYFDTYQEVSSDNMNIYKSVVLQIPVCLKLSTSEFFAKTLYVLLCFLYFFFIFYFLSLSLLHLTLNIDNDEKRNFNPALMLSYTLIPLLFWGIFLLAFFPGIVPYDSLEQLNQCNKNLFNNHHPIFHTGLIYIFNYLHKGPLLVCIFQILCFSIMTGYFFEKFNRYGFSAKLLFIILLAIVVQPFNAISSVSMLKDFLFSTGVWGITLSSFAIILEKDKFFLQKTNISIFLFCLILVSFIRYNGFVICLLNLIFLGIILKEYRIKILKLVRMYFLTSCTILFLLSFITVFDCNHRSNQVLQLAMHQVQTVLKQDGKVSDQEISDLNSLLPINTWKYLYSKYIPHTIIFESKFFLNEETDFLKFTHIYGKILKGNSIIMLKDYVFLNSYILKYRHNPEGFNYSQHVFTDIENDFPLSKQRNVSDYSLSQQSFFPVFYKNFKKFIISDKYYDSLFKPTPYFLIFLFFGFIFVLKNGKNAFCVILPCALNLFILSLTLPEMSPRYVLFLFLSAPFLILLSLINLNKQNL